MPGLIRTATLNAGAGVWISGLFMLTIAFNTVSLFWTGLCAC
jgi:hypothetical protein